MITTVLLPVYNDANGVGGLLSGTVGGNVQPPAGNDNILRDGSDDSYVEVVGSPTTQEQSQLVSMIQPSNLDIGTTLAQVMPSNTTDITVTFHARVKRTDDCGSDAAYAECWIYGVGDELFIADVPLTANFANVNVEIPTSADAGVWDLHWFVAQVAFFGFKAADACPLGSEAMGVVWSEASLTVEFAVPTPVLTVTDVDDITPLTATLLGTVNPNQTSGSSTNPPTMYPVQWGYAVSTDVSTRPTITYLGTFLGTDVDIPVAVELTGLRPGTIYYAYLGATVDGEETVSDPFTFTTPFTDPLKGVY